MLALQNPPDFECVLQLPQHLLSQADDQPDFDSESADLCSSDDGMWDQSGAGMISHSAAYTMHGPRKGAMQMIIRLQQQLQFCLIIDVVGFMDQQHGQWYTLHYDR